MDGGERRRKIDFADHLWLAVVFAGHIDNDEIVGGHRAQADRVRRIRFVRSSASSRRSGAETLLRPVARTSSGRSTLPNRSSGRDGQFERRAFQMVDENFEIVGLNVSVLGRTAEEIIGMLHDELIQRSRRRNEHRARASAAPPRAPGPLPGGSNRAWITGHHASVQRSDINSQFQCVRGHHSSNSSVAQTTFDFPPFVRQISAAVAADRFWLARLRRIRLLQIGEHDFGMQSAVGEHNGLQLARQEVPWPRGWLH